MTNLPETAVLLVTSQAGVYVPREFALEFAEAIKPGTVTDDDLQTLASGPDAEWYWEAWETVHNNAVLIDKIGGKWVLWQDEDLWAIPEGTEWLED